MHGPDARRQRVEERARPFGIDQTVVAGDLTPELLGVGFIIGPKIAGVMLAGGLTAWLGLIPLIDLFGAGLDTPVPPETNALIGAMSADTIWSSYVRYIGAGAVAGGGIITLLRALPLIWESLTVGLRQVGGAATAVLRTDQDLPLRGVFLAAAGVAVLLWWLPYIEVTFLGAILMVLFSFFFVTVSARIVGLIGSSSNPVSGMTIAALLVTSLIFLALGRTDPAAPVAVLLVGAVVCISAAIAGDTSQDLKCGYLLGATPWKQQVAEMIGLPFAAVSMAFVLQLLHASYGIGSAELAAPQATLMATVIDGVLTQSLPWALVFVGIAIAVVIELLGVPSLPFAVGLYLPLALTTPIFTGGVVRWVIEKRFTGTVLQEKREAGVLYDTTTKTLLCGDLFTQPGSGHPPIVESDILEPSEAMRARMDYYAHAPNTGSVLQRLGSLNPAILACMHGSAWRGDGAVMLDRLSKALDSRGNEV